MAKGLYFYKLVSPYREDVTKDCKLTINEIDSNFISLKDMDIKSFTFDEKTNKLILTRNSKDELPLVADISSLTEGVVHNLDVSYDRKKGELKITWDDKVAIVDGLITKDNLSDKVLSYVNSDSTLVGLGIPRCPLGINVVDRTGQYKPCIKYLNVAGGELLPKPSEVKKGDRYVTREYVSNYGYLYDYKAVKQINEDLKFGWRVPTKEDWDGMLNAVEPCECDRTHSNTVCNKEFGRFAGKVLKSMDEWEEVPSGDTCGCNNGDGDCRCRRSDIFDEVNEGCYHFNQECSDDCTEHHPMRKPCNGKGLDKFGLKLLPSGYGDGCELKNYFGKRGAFWTSTMITNTDVYAKRFDYNKCGVVQVAADPHAVMSIRLVKDYDGGNFHEVEYINGYSFHCVLMPSLTSKTGLQIWTVNNVAFEDARYCPEPIDITECAFDIQLFTAEWNGFWWVKKQLAEGESVVLFQGLDDDEYSEYRVVNGELVSVVGSIFEQITEKFEEFIQETNDKLNEEIETRQNSDAVFSGAIEDLRSEIASGSSDVASAITELNEKVDEINDELSGLTDSVYGIIEDVDDLKDDVADNKDAIDSLTDRVEALEEKQEGDVEELKEEIQELRDKDESIEHSINDLELELADEISRATDRENSIERRLISRGEYNSENGVLTLFKESDETIEIQFNGNYGTF